MYTCQHCQDFGPDEFLIVDGTLERAQEITENAVFDSGFNIEETTWKYWDRKPNGPSWDLWQDGNDDKPLATIRERNVLK